MPWYYLHTSPDTKCLLPLTSSLYLPGKLSNVEDVIIDIGTGYYVKMSTNQATQYYKNKVDYVTSNLSQLQKTLETKQDNANVVVQLIQAKLNAVFLVPGMEFKTHGVPQSFTINGRGYPAYDPQVDPWQPHANKVNRPMADDGPLYSKDDPNLTCNKVGTNTPAEMTADAAPGSEMIVKWNRWPNDHKGPVLTYAKYCGNGHNDCDNVQQSITEGWFKIDEAGYDDSAGQWASDRLIAQDISWSFNLPPAESIQQGSYLIRHEIIALHSQGSPQFYPHCIQVYINGGTGSLSGQSVTIPGNVYSNPGDDGTLYGSIYSSQVSSMVIPGPSLADDAISSAHSKRNNIPCITTTMASYIRLSGLPLGPSNCVLTEISDNGQLSLSLRRRVDVLTPNTALLHNKDQAKALWKKQSKSISEDAAIRSKPSLGEYNVFDTQIPLSEFPPAHMYIENYPHPCIVEPVSDSALWNGWKSTAWSPANLTSYGGCLLATLSSNCDLFIVAPKVNFFVGKWLPTFDVSARLREFNLNQLNDNDKSNQLALFGVALKSQILCMAWSSNPPTYSLPITPRDISVLITGTKSGDLFLWRHVQHGQMELVSMLETPSACWISLITTSEWRSCDDGFILDIYFANTDYDIYVTALKHSNSTNTTSVHSEPAILQPSNGQSLTTFKYMDGALIWTTPGSLFIKQALKEAVELDISNLSMVVGLDKLSSNFLVLWFADGEIKIIDVYTSSVITALSISATRKQRKLYEDIAESVYGSRVGKMQAPLVYSARKLPNSNGYAWLFFHRSPEDTEYVEEAKLTCILSISDNVLPDEEVRGSLIDEISANVMQLTDIWKSSTRDLSGVIERCQQQVNNVELLTLLDQYFHKFVETYSNVILTHYNPGAFQQINTAPISLESRIEQMLSCDFWTIPAFDIIRKVYLLSTHLNMMVNQDRRFRRVELEAIQLIGILFMTCQRVLGLAEMQLLPENCTQIIARLTHAAKYIQSSPPQLIEIATKIQDCYPGMGDQVTANSTQDMSDPLSLSHSTNLGENCPASGQPILFDDVRKGVSDIGISWLTLGILSDVHVKRSVSSEQVYKDLTFANADENGNELDILTSALSYSAKKCLYTNAPFVRINDIH
ncbi:hypothetical protein E3P86_00389 [Wallemia ichthyophaga]|uniref:lytic cellulose monooxygenase (C4-dehydrogenating) n=1 Tax=Wallemia ichthyophaga TaxID=245174 RepID=A0A4T0JPB3_WALIC|nr:hypothetical protein E3P86_00389 [Wallemia ichthyophaga]